MSCLQVTQNGDDGDTLMVLEVLRIEGLKSQKTRKYFVRCSVGNETKKGGCVVEGPVAKLKNPLKFLTSSTSKLELKFFLRHKIISRNTLVGGLTKGISEVMQMVPSEGSNTQTLQSNDIVFALTNPDRSSLEEVGCTVTLRLNQLNKSNAADVIKDASDKWRQTVEASGSTTDRVQDVSSTVVGGAKTGSLITFLSNLKPVIDAVDRFAEFHPYAKAAWSLFSGLSHTFTSQIDRDAKMTDLVSIMSGTYEFVLQGEPLQDITQFEDEFKKHFEMMLKQTIECAYFIREYSQITFSKRAIKASFSDIDKTIEEYKESFERLKTCFRDSASLHTTISVRRVLGKIDDLGATINLNEITYAEGMRFRRESCCLPGSHQAILDEVIRWADNIDDDSSSSSSIFLLTGPEGCGKSSIAHSVASHFEGLHRLGSSFFCTRAKPENSVPEKILNTIARDIADLEDQVKQKLSAVVSSNRSLCKTTSVKEPFDCFIKHPAEVLPMIGPIIVVIDALDECRGDEELTRELMRTLIEEIPKLPKNFRFFLTARSSDHALTAAFKAAKGVRHYSMPETLSVGWSFPGIELSPMLDYLLNNNIYSEWQIKFTNANVGKKLEPRQQQRFFF